MNESRALVEELRSQSHALFGESSLGARDPVSELSIDRLHPGERGPQRLDGSGDPKEVLQSAEVEPIHIFRSPITDAPA